MQAHRYSTRVAPDHTVRLPKQITARQVELIVLWDDSEQPSDTKAAEPPVNDTGKPTQKASIRHSPVFGITVCQPDKVQRIINTSI